VQTLEFPKLRVNYEVSVVPKTWINDRVYTEGSLTEKTLVRAIRQALDPAGPEGQLQRPKQ
jgi:hypothetical protein